MRVTGNKSLVTYKLSIHIYADGQFFYIHDAASDKVLRKEHVPLSDSEDSDVTLHRTLLQPQLQKTDFSFVEIVCHTPTTCIPLEFFQKEDMLRLYRTSFSGLRISSTDLRYQILSELEAVSLFTLSPQILQTVQRIYPQVQVLSAEGCVLEDMAFYEQKLTDREIHFYADFQEKEMVLCAFRQHRLHFTCTYQADNDADRIYYLLAVWKSLKLDEQKNICCMRGASKELRDGVAQYIKNIDTCE